MIIRERTDDIVMITQHDHAYVSGIFAKKWKQSLFHGEQRRKSVELAITEYDRGWIHADAKPFLNDQTNLPFTFMDFPLEPKLIFYKHGIDEVEAKDEYASLLCSAHYLRFIHDDSKEIAAKYVRNEQARQERLKSEMDHFNEADFEFHYELVRFCDNLSLYICLNEPGTDEADVHYFFKKGIPAPSQLIDSLGSYLAIEWFDEQTIILDPFPFKNHIKIELTEHIVSKQLIKDIGLMSAYEKAPIKVSQLQLQPR